MLLLCQSPCDSPELQDWCWGEILAALKASGIYFINLVGSVFWAWCLQSVRWVGIAKVMDWGHLSLQTTKIGTYWGSGEVNERESSLKTLSLPSKLGSICMFALQTSEFCSILTLSASLDLCRFFWKSFLSCLWARIWIFLGGVVVGEEWRWICSVLTEDLPLSLQIH